MPLFSVAMARIAVPRASSVRRLSPFPGKPTIPNKAPSNALLPHNPSDLVGVSCRFATRLYERGSPLQLHFFSPYSAAAFPFSIGFVRASRPCQPTARARSTMSVRHGLRWPMCGASAADCCTELSSQRILRPSANPETYIVYQTPDKVTEQQTRKDWNGSPAKRWPRNLTKCALRLQLNSLTLRCFESIVSVIILGSRGTNDPPARCPRWQMKERSAALILLERLNHPKSHCNPSQ
jgi:hypothetical protein